MCVISVPEERERISSMEDWKSAIVRVCGFSLGECAEWSELLFFEELLFCRRGFAGVFCGCPSAEFFDESFRPTTKLRMIVSSHPTSKGIF